MAVARGTRPGVDTEAALWQDTLRRIAALERASGFGPYRVGPGGTTIFGEGDDASLNDETGYVQLGASGGPNIGIDNNEIIARNGSGNPSQLFLNAQGGTVSVGGPQSDAGQRFYVGSNADAIVQLEADIDNVDETHSPRIELSQDGGAVTAELGISNANQPYFDTNISRGGPFTRWTECGTASMVEGTYVNSALWRCGNLAHVYISWEAGANYGGSNSGDVGNTVVAKFGPLCTGDGPPTGLASYGVGPGIFGYYRPSDAAVVLSAVTPGNQINIGDSMSFSSLVLLETGDPRG